MTWYAALRRAPALVVTSVLTLGAPITSLLNAAFVTHSLPSAALTGGAVLAVGAGLLTIAMWRSARHSAAPPRLAFARRPGEAA